MSYYLLNSQFYLEQSGYTVLLKCCIVYKKCVKLKVVCDIIFLHQDKVFAFNFLLYYYFSVYTENINIQHYTVCTAI